jgi:hypothetical protein
MEFAGRSRLLQDDVGPGRSLLAGRGSVSRPVGSIPAAPGSVLASVDRALIDWIMALDSTTSSINPVVRIRPDSPGVEMGKTSPASHSPQVEVIDAAPLDVLLSSGWRAGSSWIADRPREAIKRFL